VRLLPLIVCCVLLGFPAVAGASSPASVRLVACVPADAAEERSATFEARARAVGDSARVQVRFMLHVRADRGGGWRRVVAPALEEWLSSDPGVRRYSYARTVENLMAPAGYRAVVRVRWLDAGGVVLRTARVTSATCWQPDLRPNLIATALRVAPAPEPGTHRYDVRVRNAGRAAAGAFTVGLRMGDAELAPVALEGLAPGEARVVTFTGPACAPGTSLTATVDPDDAVEEADEDDNVLRASCPP